MVFAQGERISRKELWDQIWDAEEKTGFRIPDEWRPIVAQAECLWCGSIVADMEKHRERCT